MAEKPSSSGGPPGTKEVGIWDKIKEGINESVTAAGLEIKYVQGKKTGFKHPEQMEDQINIFRANREEVPVLRERISHLSTLTKETAESEDKGGAEYAQMAGNPGQHPHLAQILKHYSEGLTGVAAHRFQYQVVLEQVKEEWKLLETVDLHELRVKQDQANRALSDHRYWAKQKNFAKSNEYEQKYKFLSAEFVEKIHELRMKKEELLPGYLLRTAQAQVLFFRNALKEAEKAEASIRNLGPVKPTAFNGMDKLKSSLAQLDYPGENPAIEYTPSQTAPSAAPISAPPSYPPPVTAPKGVKAKALYSFTTDTAQELPFNAGDILTILSQDGQWWQAELKGRKGLVPCNYVQLM